MKVYTASSWRNSRYPSVVKAIKDAGFEVYDFQNPWDEGAAFNWSEIDPAWTQELPDVPPERFLTLLEHPIAKRGFASDKAGMDWADCCVLILPCGASAHMEAGYFAGKEKPVHILLDGKRPELTYILARCHMTVDGLIKALRES